MTDGTAAFPHALTAWELGPLRLRNRIFMSAHGTNYQTGGLPSERYATYLGERAKGGCALVFTEGTHVHPTSGGPYMIQAWRRDGTDAFERLTAAVHEHGGAIGIQLMHTGRQHEPVMTGRPAVGPTALRDPAHTTIPHELTHAEIVELIDAFADSAANAVDTGFDVVELHCSHGYLIQQFLSPWSNHRTDEWGGTPENRLRFARSVVRAVLDRVGTSVVVGVRTPAYEEVPGGLGHAEALDITAALAAEGVDFVSITAGQHSRPFLVVPPAGIPTLPFADDIAAVRRTVSCAVFASHRVRDLADAENALATGLADMVNMSRAHIADPFLVAKATEGRVDEIRPCIGCVQGCRGQLLMGLPIGCLVNPRAGREAEPLPEPVDEPRRIAVVGGGIAGLQVAATAAGRGHQVTLFERSAKVGGALAWASQLPDRGELARFTTVLADEAVRTGVDVRTGTDATSADLAEFDQVVVATGARRRPVRPEDWPDATMPVIDLTEAVERTPSAGERIVILDRGDHYNAAILLARKHLLAGAESVTIVDPVGPVAARLDPLNWAWMTRELSGPRFRLASNASDVVVSGRSVGFHHDGWTQQVDGVDLLVVLEPAEPADRSAWSTLPTPTTFVGSCDAPGGGVEIVRHAYTVGRTL